MEMLILGEDSPKCGQVILNVKKAIEELNIELQICRIVDDRRILNHGVVITPAVIFNGKIKSQGKVSSVEEIKGWLK